MTDEKFIEKLKFALGYLGKADQQFVVDYISRLKSERKAEIFRQERFAKDNGFTADCSPYYIAGEYKKKLGQRAETQLRELLSALYRRTDEEQGFTLYRKDIVELAKDYGIKEEELK